MQVINRNHSGLLEKSQNLEFPFSIDIESSFKRGLHTARDTVTVDHNFVRLVNNDMKYLIVKNHPCVAGMEFPEFTKVRLIKTVFFITFSAIVS